MSTTQTITSEAKPVALSDALVRAVRNLSREDRLVLYELVEREQIGACEYTEQELAAEVDARLEDYLEGRVDSYTLDEVIAMRHSEQQL